MAHQGTAIWEPNSLPSCSRETGLKTSLMKGHVDTSHSSCLVGFGCRGEEEACISDLLPLASLSAMNLGVWFLWLGWFAFHMKLWQQALSSQEMLSHLFRGPGKPRLGFSARFTTTLSLRHDVISCACDGFLIFFFFFLVPFLFSFRA